MMIRSIPPASAHLALSPVPAPPPMIGRCWAALSRNRARISSRVSGIFDSSRVPRRSIGGHFGSVGPPIASALGAAAQGPRRVRLPDLPRADLQGGEPTAAEAVGVDAGDVAEVQDLAGFLRGVADDRPLARGVRGGDVVAQALPAQDVRRLPLERPIG